MLGIFINASCKHVDMFAKLNYIAMFYISINEMNLFYLIITIRNSIIHLKNVQIEIKNDYKHLSIYLN